MHIYIYVYTCIYMYINANGVCINIFGSVPYNLLMLLQTMLRTRPGKQRTYANMPYIYIYIYINLPYNLYMLHVCEFMEMSRACINNTDIHTHIQACIQAHAHNHIKSRLLEHSIYIYIYIYIYIHTHTQS